MAWITGGLAGSPNLPLSDPNGTARTFAVTEFEVNSAVTNAFRLFRYRDMMLSDALGSDYLAPNWHPTNGFLLLPTVNTIATIPTKGLLGKRSLRYAAYFHISITPLTTNETKVIVRTVKADVLDGITLGHGGTAAGTVKVSPVHREEENVILEICKELESKRD